MTDLDLASLRAVAEAATDTTWPENMKPFRATFDPPTVLALIDRAERAEAEREHWIGLLEDVKDIAAKQAQQAKALAAKLEAVKRLAKWELGQPSTVLKSEIRDALAVQSAQETDQ